MILIWRRNRGRIQVVLEWESKAEEFECIGKGYSVLQYGCVGIINHVDTKFNIRFLRQPQNGDIKY